MKLILFFKKNAKITKKNKKINLSRNFFPLSISHTMCKFQIVWMKNKKKMKIWARYRIFLFFCEKLSLGSGCLHIKRICASEHRNHPEKKKTMQEMKNLERSVYLLSF